MRGLVGRTICFNEKVIPGERKGPDWRLFVHGLSFSSVIKAPGLVCVCAFAVFVYACVHAVCVWEYRGRGSQVSLCMYHTSYMVLAGLGMHAHMHIKTAVKQQSITTTGKKSVCM